MALPAESLIAHTLRKMKASMAEKASREDGRIRSGLLFTGNVHDSYPRRLLLDTRLSPLDKTAWMMIRLHALNNEGAVFPTYDELQLQLASPGCGKASRETVSRVLTMLRLTGWLSLCKRVRDEKGRVRGNIYALHDEPLTCCDAEKFDPRYLDMVLDTVSRSRNKTIRHTASEVLSDIKNEPGMRHYHSHITLFESRMGAAQTPGQLAARQRVNPMVNENTGRESGSDSVPPEKSVTYHSVRKPNNYVRNITHSVIKNTYVLPESVKSQISTEDTDMLTKQLQALPEELAGSVLSSLSQMLSKNTLQNPVGWMLAVMKRAREGSFNTPDMSVHESRSPARAPYQPVYNRDERERRRRKVASPETVSNIVAEFRASLKRANAARLAARV
ncbi:STY4528 family pathogenicity island replication protein [Escherichia coli]|uniref:STY4528 family pathogenicity island replication protein n=1 Tax=Escherichia coli TaxID=562 RepID=UPI00248035BA|nr:STY4528 family pathogenicity island replication protein [Escherichia coli]